MLGHKKKKNANQGGFAIVTSNPARTVGHVTAYYCTTPPAVQQAGQHSTVVVAVVLMKCLYFIGTPDHTTAYGALTNILPIAGRHPHIS